MSISKGKNGKKCEILAVLLLVLLTRFASPRSIKRSVHSNCNHVVVMDAGSTKTQVFVFYITPTFDDTKVLGSKKTSPALSYYGNKRAETNRLKAGLRDLIAFAKDLVPPNCVQHTKIVLKATAGLRQQPAPAAQRILKVVREVFRQSGFVFEDEFAGILSGAQEGIFAWLGGNVLLGKSSEPRSSWSGILDMGGGSTQVAFISDEDSNNANIVDFSAMGETVKLYSKSYPKGLNNARMFMLDVNDGCKKIGKCNEEAYTSPCLNPNFKGSLRFGPAIVRVAGESLPAGETDRFEYCLTQAKSFVEDVESIRSLFDKKEFLAIAGFFYSINNAHVIRNIRSGQYTLSLEQLRELAKENCQSPAENDAKGAYFQTYACLDLSYMIALLESGYGFRREDSFTVALRIDDKKVGWPVGIGMYYRNL